MKYYCIDIMKNRSGNYTSYDLSIKCLLDKHEDYNQKRKSAHYRSNISRIEVINVICEYVGITKKKFKALKVVDFRKDILNICIKEDGVEDVNKKG